MRSCSTRDPDAATGLARPSNNAGGLEGGVTNGQDLRISAFMKPISTLMKPLRSVDLATMSPSPGDDRAKRRLRGSGGGGGWRSDGGLRPRGRAPRALRRRFGGGLDARHVGSRRRGPRSLCETMIRPILRYGDRLLHQPASEVTTFDDTLQGLIDDMIETMYAAPGIGLAAPQVGESRRLFVVDLTAGRSSKELIVMINPAFAERDGTQLEEEGCLSAPGFNATVMRPARVLLRGLDRHGTEQSIEGNGPARPRVPARDGSSRRARVRRSSSGNQARSDRAAASRSLVRPASGDPSSHRVLRHARVRGAAARGVAGVAPSGRRRGLAARSSARARSAASPDADA